MRGRTEDFVMFTVKECPESSVNIIDRFSTPENLGAHL
jgi:hypothetical protein